MFNGWRPIKLLGQTVTAVSGTLGLRTEYAHAFSCGVLLPYARIEYQHDFNGQSNAGLAYADLSGAGPAHPRHPVVQRVEGGELRGARAFFALGRREDRRGPPTAASQSRRTPGGM